MKIAAAVGAVVGGGVLLGAGEWIHALLTAWVF